MTPVSKAALRGWTLTPHPVLTSSSRAGLPHKLIWSAVLARVSTFSGALPSVHISLQTGTASTLTGAPGTAHTRHEDTDTQANRLLLPVPCPQSPTFHIERIPESGKRIWRRVALKTSWHTLHGKLVPGVAGPRRGIAGAGRGVGAGHLQCARILELTVGVFRVARCGPHPAGTAAGCPRKRRQYVTARPHQGTR